MRSVVERDIGQHVAEVRVKRVRVVEELVRIIIGDPVVSNVIHCQGLDKLIRWTMRVEKSLLLSQ